MQTRCRSAIGATAMLLLAAMLLMAPASLNAQDTRCRCDYYTFSNNTNCRITVCWQLSPRGPMLCQIVAPGGSVQVPCPVYQAGIQTCTGFYAIISDTPAISICTPGLSIGGGCCVRGCRTIDDNGCPAIEFTNTDCAGADC